MATSLVSTGVQFPDSTIQTTAATGSPTWTTLGTTLFFWGASPFTTSTNPTATGMRGLIVASNNISTTAASLISPLAPEIQLNMANTASNSATQYPAVFPMSAGGVGYSLDYTNYHYFVKDGYTNRYNFVSGGVQVAGETYRYTELAYTEDFNRWLPYTNATGGQSVTYYPSAFNNYTGTRVYTFIYTVGGTYATSISRAAAGIAYNATATPTNTFGVTGNLFTVKFIDTGSAGTSYFLAISMSGSALYAYKSTDDGINWTVAYAGSGNNPGRIAGNDTELMFYSYNSGIFRSLNGGASWGQYSYGDSSYGTSNSYYPMDVTWNGSFFLSLFQNASDSINYKAMGSGTSWTRLSNFPAGVSNNNFTSVAYNPTLGLWLAIKSNGELYSNSNSNPSSGTWSFVRQVWGGNTTVNAGARMYVIAANSWNF